ncbi:MAG: hypothetical protein AAB642_03170 [Patescibacteria group bacterium]
MRVTKCDLCRKDIKDQPVTAGFGFFSSSGAELCRKCGGPILSFLRKHKFIDEERERAGKIRKN